VAFPPDLSSSVTVGSYRAAALAARLMPAVAARALGPALGFSASMASGERRDMIARHLVRADPTLAGRRLRRAVQEAFDSYARYWLESFRLPHLSTAVVDREMRADGYHMVVDALARGNGVILALPHLGGWEWAGRWLVNRGHGVTVVVERLEPPELFEWFADLRAKLGMQVVELGPEAGRAVSAALRRNDIVCLLCDRDIRRTGVEVEFFGERTTLPAGPVTLGYRTGAPVFPTAVYFSDGDVSHHGIVRPSLVLERSGDGLRADVGTGTQALAAGLEHLIRRAPSQWHMFQPNWPSDPGYDEHQRSARVSDSHTTEV
jgi:lauroyl/myristoyl acyltransferase